MHISRGILPLFAAFAFLSACNSDSTGTVSDSDNDGIADVDDPNPNGATFNRLNGTFTGGDASVVTITWYDSNGDEDVSGVYDGDLTQDCAESWYPQGTLCDESPTTDDPDVSTKTNEDSGATWEGTSELGTGVLIVDACKTGGCTAVDVNEAHVFQMFSDGKTTNIRFYAHPDMGDTPPAWDDPNWQPLADFSVVNGGESVGGDPKIVDLPTVISLTPTVSRYFRIDVQNDGRHGDPDYIELRSVKMFAVALP